MKYLKITLLFSALLAFACTGGKKITTDSPTQKCLPTSIDFDAFRRSPKDPFDIKAAAIDGNCLKVQVTYGGGCGGANFKLVGDKTQTKGTPTGTLYLLRLSLDDQDHCRSIVDSTMHFSLIDLQVSDEKSVDLKLKDWEETMSYSY